MGCRIGIDVANVAFSLPQLLYIFAGVKSYKATMAL